MVREIRFFVAIKLICRRKALEFFLFLTEINVLSYRVRAEWSQAKVVFLREIRVIIAATKNSQIPQINMTQCDFLMCGDVLTDTVHLRVIWGNASRPQGWTARFTEQKVLVLKTALIIWHVRFTLLICSFTTTSSQSPHYCSRVDTEDLVSERSSDWSNIWVHIFEELL